ncbi:MAG TPA: acetylxylan esterase [Chthoniobacterales bacterium]
MLSRAIWKTQKLLLPPFVFPVNEIAVDGVRSLHFEGPPFRGKPTRVFAFYGVPKEAAAGKVPAMVLVHGGGGSAFADWVKLWNSRGYAAIAFDHGGHLPVKENGEWKVNPDGGPPMGECDQMDEPISDQWMYHAVADTLLAHSLLLSFPEVDPERTGITGISWGAVVTSIAVALDSRFKFAAPVYGCGFISEDFGDGTLFVGRSAPPETVARWRELWDPAQWLPRVEIPLLWVNGTNDFAFTPRAWRLSHRLPRGPRTLSLQVEMPHGHDGPGESPEEIRAFADSLCKNGAPLAVVLRHGTEGCRAWAEFQSPALMRGADLNYTGDGGPWQERKWHIVPATIESGRASAPVPDGATAWFFNLIDKRGLVVSSEHESVQDSARPAG